MSLSIRTRTLPPGGQSRTAPSTRNMKVILILAVGVFSLAACEPPAPNAQYLPPGRQNGANGGYPSNGNGGYPSNGNGYRPPNGNGGYQPPSQNYGPPSVQYGPPSTQYGPPNGNGNGNKVEDQTEPASYMFKYDVQDQEAGLDFGHEESREGDDTKGKYYVLLPDGRKQIVEYTADADGYKPKITYEETGNGNGNGNGNGGYQYPKNGGRNGNGNGNGYSNGGYQY